VTYHRDGKVETVRYSMLLNELPKQARENSRQAAQTEGAFGPDSRVNAKLLGLEQALQARKTDGKLAAVARLDK
jgi:hypothetical protein